MSIYYVDWYQLICVNCGQQIQFPMADQSSIGLAIELAEQIHDRDFNNYHKCKCSTLQVTIIEKMSKIEL